MPLPEGFEVETGLPEGFEVETEIPQGFDVVPQSQPKPELSWYDKFKYSNPQTEQMLQGGLGLLKGSTFGLFDEVGSYGNALIDKAFGSDKSVGDLYNQYKRNYEQFEDTYGGGGANFVGELAGGVVNPLSRVATLKLLNPKLSTGKKILGGVLAGTGEGALYGFGNARGGLGDRLDRAKTDATMGAILGGGVPAIGGAMNAAGEIANTLGIRKALANTLGLFRNATDDVVLSPVNQKIARKLQLAKDYQLKDALEQMQKSKASGNPLFLQETDEIGGSMKALSDYVANADATGGIAQKAIKNREIGGKTRSGKVITGIKDRIINKLDDISPQKSTLQGNQSLREAAQTRIKQAKKARGQVAAPVYKKAFENPIIDDPKLKQMIGLSKLGGKTKTEASKKLVSKIKQLKDNYPNLRKLPDNHLKILDKVKRSLDDDIETALKNKNTSEYQNLTDLKTDFLNRINWSNKDYRKALRTFSKNSPDVTGLTDGQVGVIDALTDNRLKTAAKKIFELEPEQIVDLKKKFGNDEAFTDGVRAYIQDLFENKGSNATAIKKLIGGIKEKAKLKAALGDKADDLIEFLENEARIVEGTRSVAKGSDTFGRQQQDLTMTDAISMLRRPTRGLLELGDRLVAGRTSSQEDKLKRILANTLFNSRRGAKSLENILQYRGALREAQKQAALDAANRTPISPYIRSGLISALSGE